MSLPTYRPMLATPWDKPFDDDGWWFEIKWDGYRGIVGNDGGRIRATSRRGLDLTGAFPELNNLSLPPDVVVDGEVVAFDDDGRPSFSALQTRTGFGGKRTGEPRPTTYVAYDLLYQGRPLIDLPYEERRARLGALELPLPILDPEPTQGAGVALFDAVQERGIEGIVGKKLGSRYFPGRRSAEWRKVSVRSRVRAVVGGYLPGEGSRASTFGSVLVGLYAEDGLRFIGAVGSGFDEATLKAFKASLVELERPTTPFVNKVVVQRGRPVWVEPGIVVSVEYKEWTHDDHLRAPVFKGVEIADPASVTWAEERPG